MDASSEPLDIICVSTRITIDPGKLVRSNERGNLTLTFMEKLYFAASKYLFIQIVQCCPHIWSEKLLFMLIDSEFKDP